MIGLYAIILGISLKGGELNWLRGKTKKRILPCACGSVPPPRQFGQKVDTKGFASGKFPLVASESGRVN